MPVIGARKSHSLIALGFLGLVLGLLVAACSGEIGAPPCRSDLDCATDALCELDRGDCVPRPSDGGLGGQADGATSDAEAHVAEAGEDASDQDAAIEEGLDAMDGDGLADADEPSDVGNQDGSGAEDAGEAPDGSHQDGSEAEDAGEAPDAETLEDAGFEDGGDDLDAATEDAANLDSGSGADGGLASEEEVEWVFSSPTGLLFTRTEVTVAQWEACVRDGGCSNLNVDRSGGICNLGNALRTQHPINCVDWIGADDFCRWAGGRLPTESEWYEEASGGQARTYAWGTDGPTCARAVMSAGGAGCGRSTTWAVCSKRPGDSLSGLCDITGNVWEWTATSLFGGKVVRGGGWDDAVLADLATTARYPQMVLSRLATVGLRCVQ